MSQWNISTKKFGENVSLECVQLVAACQFVYEEKYITKYDVHPLKVSDRDLK